MEEWDREEEDMPGYVNLPSVSSFRSPTTTPFGRPRGGGGHPHPAPPPPSSGMQVLSSETSSGRYSERTQPKWSTTPSTLLHQGDSHRIPASDAKSHCKEEGHSRGRKKRKGEEEKGRKKKTEKEERGSGAGVGGGDRARTVRGSPSPRALRLQSGSYEGWLYFGVPLRTPGTEREGKEERKITWDKRGGGKGGEKAEEKRNGETATYTMKSPATTTGDGGGGTSRIVKKVRGWEKSFSYSHFPPSFPSAETLRMEDWQKIRRRREPFSLFGVEDQLRRCAPVSSPLRWWGHREGHRRQREATRTAAMDPSSTGMWEKTEVSTTEVEEEERKKRRKKEQVENEEPAPGSSLCLRGGDMTLSAPVEIKKEEEQGGEKEKEKHIFTSEEAPKETEEKDSTHAPSTSSAAVQGDPPSPWVFIEEDDGSTSSDSSSSSSSSSGRSKTHHPHRSRSHGTRTSDRHAHGDFRKPSRIPKKEEEKKGTSTPSVSSFSAPTFRSLPTSSQEIALSRCAAWFCKQDNIQYDENDHDKEEEDISETFFYHFDLGRLHYTPPWVFSSEPEMNCELPFFLPWIKEKEVLKKVADKENERRREKRRRGKYRTEEKGATSSLLWSPTSTSSPTYTSALPLLSTAASSPLFLTSTNIQKEEEEEGKATIPQLPTTTTMLTRTDTDHGVISSVPPPSAERREERKGGSSAAHGHTESVAVPLPPLVPPPPSTTTMKEETREDDGTGKATKPPLAPTEERPTEVVLKEGKEESETRRKRKKRESEEPRVYITYVGGRRLGTVEEEVERGRRKIAKLYGSSTAAFFEEKQTRGNEVQSHE